MITNINFPEGTKIDIERGFFLDYFDDDFPLTLYQLDLSNKGVFKQFVLKPLNTEMVEELFDFGDYWGENGISYDLYTPTINTKNMTEFYISKCGILDLVLTGGSTKLTQFSNVNVFERVWLDVKDDFSILRSKFVDGTKHIIPYGDVTVPIRILQDGQWLAGEEVKYDNKPMQYMGGGLYQTTITIVPRNKYWFNVSTSNYSTIKVVNNIEETIMLGDNSNLQRNFEGADILNYVIDNPNGWYYDGEVNGIRNNTITGKQSTSVTFEFETDTIDIVWGQDSEENYDFCTIYDGNNMQILSTKSKKGDDFVSTITSPTKTFRFEYKKDNSGDKGKDCFWLKSVSYATLPPYPEN